MTGKSKEQIEQFFLKCQGLDWYCEFSDDYSVCLAGQRAKKLAFSEADTDPIFRKIYDDHSKYYFSGDSFGTPQTKEPELSDYLEEGNV
jgi:hypothetical protein